MKMGVIKKEDVVGYWVDDKLLCIKCAEGKENLTQDKIVTTDEVENEENLYFCDHCHEELG